MKWFHLGIIFISTAVLLTTECCKTGTQDNPNPKIALGNKVLDIEVTTDPTKEATYEYVKKCVEECSYDRCRGGSSDHPFGGQQLNTFKTCERICVWMNGTTPNDEPPSPGQCVNSIAPGFAYIDCKGCQLNGEDDAKWSELEQAGKLLGDLSGFPQEYFRKRENIKYGTCCDTLEIKSDTKTEIDEVVPGQYFYYQDYQGYPAYKKKPSTPLSSAFPLYLFYNENRWILEPTLGSTTTLTGKELWGLLRYNGSYMCPEDVGKQWMYYADSSGIVDTIDETIAVTCSSSDEAEI